MKTITIMAVIVCTAGLLRAQSPTEEAPRHEIGLTLGALSKSAPLATGTALQANYGIRLLDFAGSRAALYGEVHLLASPLRNVNSTDRNLTANVASLYVTPGIRLKFAPAARVSPWLAVGGGWADYEQSTTTLAGARNPAPRNIGRGVVDFGGGADFKVWRFVALRAEVRDFYSGAPAWNSSAIRGGLHNVVAGGGLVIRLN